MNEFGTRGISDFMNFSLVDAILGRRSRRFGMGMEIPSGVFQYKSKHAPQPLSEIEKMAVVTAMAGNTGWHNLIPFNARYQPKLPNYAGAAGGRCLPSAAGFHTSSLFFTDDDGVYVLDTRDAPALVDRQASGQIDFEAFVEANRKRVRKLQDGRLKMPYETPYFEGHNIWVANRPGTLLAFPVVDMAQQMILALMYFLQNGQVMYDDINRRAIPGMQRYERLAKPADVLPLTFAEMFVFSEGIIEIGSACCVGALVLQGMGLGGWMFSGLNPYAVLGVLGDAKCPGLGFSFEQKEGWSVPNPTGLKGVFEGYCPPFYKDMRAAVEAAFERKFGAGGPFNADTPGPWKDSSKVRGAAQVHDEEFLDCLTLEAQYVLETFGKFPATVPSIWLVQYVQAQHIDLESYDKFYKPGAYLGTHAEHMEQWHGGQ
jgi:hypothetical protein